VKILAPTDLSPISINGVKYAATLANYLLMDLELLYVIHQPMMLKSGVFNSKKLDDLLENDGVNELNLMVSDLQKEFPNLKNIQYHISHAPKVDVEICQFAHKSECDMVVLATHGRSGIESIIMGSVTLSVINRCSVPVLTIPVNTLFNPIKKIALPANLSEIEYQLNTAIPFALLFNAYIEIVHVSKQKLEKTNEIELAFKKFVDKQLYPKIHYHLIKNDDIPSGIISYLQDNVCDMIIFFTHELSLYERIYNLGISNKVIPFANLPILIIKSF
jgi:nucleotide-binding universal stress UspA family protein